MNNTILVLLSISVIGLFGLHNAFAVSKITFEPQIDGTIIANQYQTDGVQFSSGTSVPKILDDSGEMPPGPPSTPNILVSNYGSNNGDIIISVVNPGTFVPTDASSISFYLYSVGKNKVTVETRDSGGNVIDTQMFQHLAQCGSSPQGPPENGWGCIDSYTFSGPIRTVTITSSKVFVNDGYGIDNVLVQFGAIGGVLLPIDNTALLLAGAQSSLAWILPLALVGAGVVAFKLKRN